MTARLWLVRHGETAWSAAGRLTGWTDVELNDAGCHQSRDLRDRLADGRFVGVWSSDLRRAEQTSHLAYGPAVVDRRLRELDFGGLEGLTYDDLSPADQQGLVDFDGFAAPGGESVRALRARVLTFVGSLRAGDHLVFTHGGVIRVLLRTIHADRRVSPGEIVVYQRDPTVAPPRATYDDPP